MGSVTRYATKHELYPTWCMMRWRCHCPRNQDYHNYGARGIAVCDRWKCSFWAFVDDMGPRPTRQYTIDRIDNNGNYNPSNCRWATRKEQARNNRRNVWLEYNGKRMILDDWANELGIDPKLLSLRLARRGWSIERALTTPVGATSLNESKRMTVRVDARILAINGVSMTVAEASRKYSVGSATISKRLRSGRTGEQAVGLSPLDDRMTRRWMIVDGQKLSMKDASSKYGIAYGTIKWRKRIGCTDEESVTPLKRRQKK